MIQQREAPSNWGNRDDIDDLQRRLEILPRDLEGLYYHMLSRIDPFCMGKAARMFQVC
jgi:hypothetical protein